VTSSAASALDRNLAEILTEPLSAAPALSAQTILAARDRGLAAFDRSRRGATPAAARADATSAATRLLDA
jgi:hypothetical protein